MGILEGLFGNGDKNTYHGNDERKRALAALEDRRLAFAKTEEMASFSPSRAVFATLPEGGFSGVAVSGGRLLLIRGPGPYEQGVDFSCEACEGGVSCREEEYSVPASGMGGLAGFGRRGAQGTLFHIASPSKSGIVLRLVTGESCYLAVPKMKCALASAKRRRGNAAFPFDMRPLEKRDRERAEKAVREMLAPFAEKPDEGSALP